MYKFIFYDVNNNHLGSIYINDCFTKVQALNKMVHDMNYESSYYEIIKLAARMDIVCYEV